MKKRGTKTWMRLLAAVLTLCALSGFMYFSAAAESAVLPVCYEHGDVNGDGTVDAQDAIQLLYHSLFPDDPEYAINQDGNFDEDGKLTAKDAIYLLYSTFESFAEDYPLKGMIHQYQQPQWNWLEDGTAEATFLCGCGKSHTLAADSVEKGEETAPTCLLTGARPWIAKVLFEGTSYTAERIEQIAALGHQAHADASCEDDTCVLCEITIPGLGHAWEIQEDKTVAATCSAAGSQSYKCSNCDEEKTVTLEGRAAHAFAYLEDEAVEGCGYRKVYVCPCGEKTTGDVFYKHTYTAKLTKEATCQEEGEKTFTCAACGDSYTEVVATNDAHTWDSGVTNDTGITTFTCACGATKTAVTGEGNVVAAEKELLKENEMQVSDVALKLDEQTLEGLGQSVQVQVDTVAADSLNVDQETLAQIGENPVYDFALASDGETVSQFAGQVTISLPYTLQDGDDVDCIDVWFISDDGEVTCVQGTYANGFVTFTTDHFSYYTVTRLTQEQRCKYYGHVMNYAHLDPTCIAEGFDLALCQRCDYVEKDEVLPMVDHKITRTVTEPTCDKDGYFEEICDFCKQKTSGEIPALGHNWALDQDACVKADCINTGKDVYACTRTGCDATLEKETARTEHDYEEIVEEADCETPGRKYEKCKVCGDITKETSIGFTGHHFRPEDTIWEWADDYSSATATLICTRHPDKEEHNRVIKVKEKDIDRTMSGSEVCGGVVTYTAHAKVQGVDYVFTDTKTLDLTGKGHEPATSWSADEEGHYHACIVCKEKTDLTDHVWGSEVTVVKAPTCKNEGTSSVTCQECGYVKTYPTARTVRHNYKDGKCADCGKAQPDCQHIRQLEYLVEMPDLGQCEDFYIIYLACECGEKIFQMGTGGSCQYVDQGSYWETLDEHNGRDVYCSVCTNCDMVLEYSFYVQTDWETCESFFSTMQRIRMDGVLIAENETKESTGKHNLDYCSQTVSYQDAAELGFCGGYFETVSCACGEKLNTRINLNCDLPIGEGDAIVTCAGCGVEYHNVYTREENENCILTVTYDGTYYKDGKQIFAYTNVHEYVSHDYRVTDALMDGDVCADGVIITETCADCGDQVRSYSTGHVKARENIIDLRGKGYCAERIIGGECACGEEKFINTEGGYCNWSWIGWDEGIRSDVYQCLECGLIRAERQEVAPKEDQCRIYYTNYYTYREADGTDLKQLVTGYYSTSHVYYSEVALLEGASTCEEGVLVSQLCRDCDYHSEYTSYSHENGRKAVYDLKELGFCGGEVEIYGCACGESGYENWRDECCYWETTGYENGYIVEQCQECKGVRKYTQSVTKVEPCVFAYNTIRILEKDGVKKADYAWNDCNVEHRNVYELTLLGNTCEEGYRVTEKCLECDYTADHGEYSEYHGTWIVERESLSEGELCGALDRITYRCACGLEESVAMDWTGGGCGFGSEDYSDSEQGWRSECAWCGAERIRRSDSHRGEDYCQIVNTNDYIIRKDGKEIVTWQTWYTERSHDYIYTYQHLGDSCEDGYTYTAQCADCGESFENTDIMTYHSERKVARQANDTDCGREVSYVYSCGCGEEAYFGEGSDCYFEYMGENTITGEDTFRCVNCGLEQIGRTTSENGAGSCDIIETYDYGFYKDDVELFRHQHTLERKEHMDLATFELMGETCDDGYNVIYTCADCGRTKRENDWYGEGNSFRVAYYDLTDYGMCGGYIQNFACACGERSEWGYYNDPCNWNYTGNVDPATGAEEAYCPACGTYRYHLEDGRINPDTCSYEGVYLVKLVRDGETLLEINGEEGWESHTFLVQSFQLHGETCDDGYSVELKCAYCDHLSSAGGIGHGTYTMERIYLDQVDSSLCGGYVDYEKCACGREYNVARYYGCDMQWNSWSVEGTDGLTHNFEEGTCADCSLNILREYWYVYNRAECTRIGFENWTICNGDQEIRKYELVNYWDEHTMGDPVVSLAEGSVTCDDGINLLYTCQICGEQETHWTDGHTMGRVSSIDLKPYGAVCDTELVEMVCACGKYRNYELKGENACDMDWNGISHFVPGTIDTAQDTTEGWITTYSYSYLLTCAVTDPVSCAFKIRMSNHWLKEGCEAVHYQVWQIGYDPDTDTWLDEITIATGERHTYHDYAYSDIYEDLADGGYRSGGLHTCVDCGSTYRWEHHYDANGNQRLYENEAINTLDNGDSKRLYYVYEYGLEHAGFLYTTKERTERTYADGSEFWSQYIFEYDFSAGCWRTEYFTNSDGHESVNQNTCHQNIIEHTVLKETTCTQFGEELHTETCQVCGEVNVEYTHRYNPHDHYWYEYNDETGMYTCTECGLENVNGASGAIVMEDLTDYDNGTDYVVGYWNRGSVEALSFVTVILDDAAADAENMIILEGIEVKQNYEYTDGFNGISFSKADAEAAAAQAVAAAGYTGTYHIRFTFVPKNYEDTLDYAITFEDKGE